ncbi:MAG: amidohydrolase [Lachnospiraceae bacterium]|nr:amidohydrolase [Lachnospiraceae bacterium]
MMREEIQAWFDGNRELLVKTSRDLWEHPEASQQECYACEVLGQLLREQGFEVSEGSLAGLATAFEAKWGSGSPKIGFLAEYDALPGLAQDTVSSPAPLDQPFGHGCGHNLLGTGAVGAALALKAVMEEKKLPGTVYLYGCPSEEIMEGKIVMTKEHVFDHLDAALSWHPGDYNRASEESYQAMMSVEYHFTGKASHAAMAPQEGFSALDAVELMDVGVNYLREHVPAGGQLHYVILNGGQKPNIVPEKAAVWQFIRANTTADLKRIAARLDDIAEGAAKMTGTTFTKKLLSGCNETRIVPELVRLMNEVMEQEVPAIDWTEEEKAFSRELLTALGTDREGLAARFGADVWEHPLDESFSVPTGRTVDILGSSDISDVSYVVPTGMLFAACYPKGTPNHTWGVTACSGQSIGQKGMLYAAQVMAATGLRLVEDAKELEAVKESFRQALGGIKYAPVVP